MWPPVVAECNYGFIQTSNNPHEHYHHHHYPHTSDGNFDCYQSLSCPSDLPVESSYYQPVYQELSTQITPNYWCPPEDHCNHQRCLKRQIPEEQSKIFEEISKECEHLLKENECDKCKIRHENGIEDSLEMEDLIDIVMQTVEQVKKKETEKAEFQMINKKRVQNKAAAARYRDKQKAKWEELVSEKLKEERRNVELKNQAKELEEQVAEMRKKFLESIPK